MKFSIIVPVYNVEIYLEECINSLYKQGLEYNEFEVITINDGSTDNSLSILNNLAKVYPNIIIINKENEGPSCARNAGLDIAKGEYICFVDSDDYVFPDKLRGMYNSLSLNNLDILQIEYTRTGDQKSSWIKHRKNFIDKVLNADDFFINVTYGEHYTCTFLFKREFINKHKLRFRKGLYYEDANFMMDCLTHELRAMYSNVIYYYYRRREGAITSKATMKHINDSIFLMSRYQDQIRSSANSKEYDKRVKEEITRIYIMLFIFCAKNKELYAERHNILKRMAPYKKHFTGQTLAKENMELFVIKLFGSFALYILHLLKG